MDSKGCSEDGHLQRWRHAGVEVEAIVTVHDHTLLLRTGLRAILTLLALDDQELAIGQFGIEFQELIEQLLEHHRFDLVLHSPFGLGLQSVL